MDSDAGAVVEHGCAAAALSLRVDLVERSIKHTNTACPNPCPLPVPRKAVRRRGRRSRGTGEAGRGESSKYFKMRSVCPARPGVGALAAPRRERVDRAEVCALAARNVRVGGASEVGARASMLRHAPSRMTRTPPGRRAQDASHPPGCHAQDATHFPGCHAPNTPVASVASEATYLEFHFPGRQSGAEGGEVVAEEEVLGAARADLFPIQGGTSEALRLLRQWQPCCRTHTSAIGYTSSGVMSNCRVCLCVFDAHMGSFIQPSAGVHSGGVAAHTAAYDTWVARMGCRRYRRV